MSKIRLYLTDDHTIFRDGLKALLKETSSYEIIGESGDGGKALKEIEALNPDIVILDISLPTLSGIDICRQLKKRQSGLKIIILSRHNNEVYVEQLLRLGVSGYVLKDDTASDLNRAIDAAIKGHVYISPKVTGQIINEVTRKRSSNNGPAVFNKIDLLTSKEKSVLKLLSEGKSNDDIAGVLCISSVTVKKHRANIMKKLDIHKIADLVVFAVKCGLRDI